MMRQGFTLIQLSILLTVAALVAVTVLPNYRTGISNNTLTTVRLNNVLQALRQYQVKNGALPCPADASKAIDNVQYGVSAANPGTTNNCGGGSPAANYTDSTNHVAIGMVPVRTLGLSRDYALDGFTRDITYAVDTHATVCWAGTLYGTLSINDNGSTQNSVVALISHGADGHGAWEPLTGASGTAVRLNAGSTDTNQLTNAHVDTTFTPTTVLNSFVKSLPTVTFDDLLVYQNPLWNIGTSPAAWPYISTLTGPASGSYHSGATLSFTATFSGVVTVTGTPRLALSALGSGSIGTGNVAYANYASGSGSNTIIFSYTVASGDTSPTGIAAASPVNLAASPGPNSISNTCVLTFTAPSLTGVIIS